MNGRESAHRLGVFPTDFLEDAKKSELVVLLN